MKNNFALCLIASGAIGALSLANCSSGTASSLDMSSPDMSNPPPDAAVGSFTVGGNVTGLAGMGLVLQLNGAGDLPVDASGAFTFAGKIMTGASYAVTVKAQPTAPAQTCTVTSGSGTVGTANVAQVAISCVTNTYKIGGMVSGLAGSVVLQNNGGDDLTVANSGAFEFATQLVVGKNYAVTVKTNPPGQLCTVDAGSGTITDAAITSIKVTCATPVTCKAIKAANPAATDGDYMIDPDGAGPLAAITAFCDMTTDGGGYTEYAITGGISTYRFDEKNSCADYGLKIAVGRTKSHMTAMLTKYGMGYFKTVPGVYSPNDGVNTTGCAMNSKDDVCGKNWVSIDAGAWWARDTAYSEPNGDYTAGCWLNIYGVDGNGDLQFNDYNCNNATGDSYVCSDNAK